MSTLSQINEFSGIRDLYTLLDVINNKDKYKSLLNQLESSRKELNETIETVGKAKNIEKLLGEAEIREHEAQSLVEDAKKKCDQMRFDAKKKSDEIITEAENIKSSMEGVEVRLKKERLDFNEYSTSFRKELDSRLSEVEAREALVDKKEVEVSNLKDRYGKALSELKKSVAAA